MINNFSKNAPVAIKKTLQNRRVQEGLLVSASVATLVATSSLQRGPETDGNARFLNNPEQQGTYVEILHYNPETGKLEPTAANTYRWYTTGNKSHSFFTLHPTYLPTNADVGKRLTVRYTRYEDGEEIIFESTSSIITNLNDAPTGNISIGNVANVGLELVADSSKLVDIDGLGVLHYQWKVGGINVGTDTKTYTPTNADIGKSISVDISYTDNDAGFWTGSDDAKIINGANELVSSNVITKIFGTPPEKPIISTEHNYETAGVEFLVNTRTTGDQNTTSITTLKNGGFVVTWVSSDQQDGDTDSTAIKAQIFDVNGKAVGSEFLVNSQTATGQYSAHVAGLENGNFVVSWYSSDQQDSDKSSTAIKARIFDATGVEVKAEFLVNSQYNLDQYEPSITALANGGFVITWYSFDVADSDITGTAIKAQIFNAAGETVNGEFLVNSRHVGDQNEPSIVGLKDSGFVITWHSFDHQDADTVGGAIKAQIYSADGTKVNGEFLVNSNHQSGQGDAHVSALNNGGFVITWDSYDAQGGDTNQNAIRAQVYDATGTATGSELLVNSRYDGFQFNPVVTTLKNGDFVITWYSEDKQDADTSGFAVKAQLFNEDGGKLGGEFLVNSEYNGDQLFPTIAALDDGGFVVTWHSADQTSADTDSNAIKAQIFKLIENLSFNAGETSYLNLTAELVPSHESDTLGNVTISGVPTEATFNQGTNNGDNSWTLTQAQLEGLQISFTSSYNGQVTLEIAVASTATDGASSTTKLSVPISVGNLITGTTGADSKTATAGVDHIELGRAIDTLTETGNKADYTFKIVGDSLQVTHTATGATNADLLNSVEKITFNDQTIDVKDLQSAGDITDFTSDEFTHWLNHNYEYDVV